MTEVEARVLAERLITARRLRELTQEELARRSGVPQPQISRLERGQTAEPSLFAVARIAEALELDLRLLVDPDGNRFLHALLGEEKPPALAGGEEMRGTLKPRTLLPARTLDGAQGRAISIGTLDDADASELRMPLAVIEDHLLISGRAEGEYAALLSRIIAGLGCEPGGLLFLDTHGTLAERTLDDLLAAVTADRAKDVLYVDFSDASQKIGVNPLDFPNEHVAPAIARTVADIVIRDELVAPRARQCMVQALTAFCEANLQLARLGSEQRLTLFDLPGFFADVELRRLIVEHSRRALGVLHFFDPETGIFELASDKEKQTAFVAPIITALERFAQAQPAAFALGRPRNHLGRKLAEGRIVVAKLARRPHEARGGEDLAAMITATLPHHLVGALEGRRASQPVRLALTHGEAVFAYETALAVLEQSLEPKIQVLCATERLPRSRRIAERLLTATGSKLVFSTHPKDAASLAVAIAPDGRLRHPEDLVLQGKDSFYGQLNARDEAGRLIASGPFHATATVSPRPEPVAPTSISRIDAFEAAKNELACEAPMASPSGGAEMERRRESIVAMLARTLAAILEAEWAED